MDADTIMEIRPALTEYLHEFDGCMGRASNRTHMGTYVSGQLSDLDRKSVEPIADAAGVPPRILQEFLSMMKWDDCAVIDRLQRRVVRRHGDSHSIGIIDEVTYPKKSDKTACVGRQSPDAGRKSATHGSTPVRGPCLAFPGAGPSKKRLSDRFSSLGYQPPVERPAG